MCSELDHRPFHREVSGQMTANYLVQTRKAAMLAPARFRLLLTVFPLLAFCGLCSAQFQGVPPGQFQGVPTTPFHGVPANPFQGVPSGSGVRGYGPSAAVGFPGCCATFFLPSGFSPLVPVPSLAQGHRHRRHHRDEALSGVAEPVYIPYAVPYAASPDDRVEDDQDAAEPVSSEPSAANRAGGKRGSDHYMGRATGQYLRGKPGVDAGDNGDVADYADSDSARAEAVPEKPEEPVIAQPSTVLVFRDGHRSDVVNYAIVGDTLFAFADGRSRRVMLAELDLAATRKANDDRGVEFKVPGSR